jgi:hypothetical protein
MKFSLVVIHTPKATCMLLFLIAIILVTGASNQTNDQRRNSMPMKTIPQVLAEHAQELMSIPGVVGLAQGLCDGRPCIKVFIKEKTPEVNQKVPSILEGYPVMIEETGEIRALPKSRD